MKTELYFHGTRKAFLKSLLSEGLKTKYGRATLTTNPLYASYYSSSESRGSVKKSETAPIINEGALVVFECPEKHIRVAKNSHLIFEKSETVTGWPNRYKREQHGYFPDKKRKFVCLNKRHIAAVFAYNNILLKTLERIKEKITAGKINEKYIETSAGGLRKIFSDKKIQLAKPKVSFMKIAERMIYGMIRNEVLHEIRQSELSALVLSGWKIENMGYHPVKLKSKKEIVESVGNIGRIINRRFISEDVRKEYFELIKKMG